MNLQFVPAGHSDIDVIFSLLKELIDAYEDVQSIQYEKVLAWCRRQIEEHISEYTCILADGAKAGYYLLKPDGDRMELDNFYVLPNFRNHGIGTAVLKRCITATDKPIYLYCFTRNHRAMALYSRLGFRTTETIRQTRCILQRDPSEE